MESDGLPCRWPRMVWCTLVCRNRRVSLIECKVQFGRFWVSTYSCCVCMDRLPTCCKLFDWFNLFLRTSICLICCITHRFRTGDIYSCSNRAASFAHGHFSFTRNFNHLVVNQPFKPFLCPFLTVNIIIYSPSSGLGSTHIEGTERKCWSRNDRQGRPIPQLISI